VDGQRREPVWRGAYADAGILGPGQVAVLRYPLDEVGERIEVDEKPLAVRWRGDTVLEIRPSGAPPVPYQRQSIARAATPWQALPSYPRLAGRLWPLA